MFDYSETKKIILASLLALGIVLTAYFSPKIDLELVKLKLEKFIQKIDNRFSVLGQEIAWQVFPSYPYRLVHLASNLAFQSETLFLANKEMNQLVETCDCRYAQSSCIGGKSPTKAQKTIEKELSVGLSPEMAKKIDDAVNSIDKKIRESISQARMETKNAFDKIGTELDKIKPKETQSLETKPRFFSTARAQNERIDIKVVEEMERRLEKIEDQTLGELKRKEEEVRRNIEIAKEKFKNELDKLKDYPKTEIPERVEKTYQNFLQDTENELKKISPETLGKEFDTVFKDFSQQIVGLPSQIFSELQANLEGILVGLKEELERALPLQNIFAFVKDPLGFFLQGGCRPSPLRTFGDPCSNVRNAIENKQTEIDETIRQINYLQSLLKKEMESGLDEELRKIMPENFEKIKTDIEQLLQDSQKIVSTAENNKNLPYQNVVSKCSANCNLGHVFGLKACLAAGTGEQRQIELTFKTGISLEDLELGQVGIKNINLGLPEKIVIPKFGAFSPFTIIGDRTVIDIEKARAVEFKPAPLQLQVPYLPSFPEPPAFSFSCADLEKQFSSYTCTSAGQTTTVESIESEWFFQTFSYLSEACQKLPGMSDRWLTEKAENCFDPEKIIPTIVQECNALCPLIGEPLFPLPEICQKIMKSCKDRDKLVAAADRCRELFRQENESVPSACTYWIDLEGNYIFSRDFNPVAALEKKCSDLKKVKRKEPPEPCKILPLFLGQIEKGLEEIYVSGGGNCPRQTISDAPPSIPGCSASPPTIPKIRLPKIIVPDITLPSFSIWPFLEVKLPNFIFEDLVLPDIELCNLDDCRDIFPDLRFKLPTLTFPKIELPPIELGEVLGVPLPDIQLPSIYFPPIPFPFLKLPSLGDLIMPNLDLPSISLPKPKITFEFLGIDTGAIFAYIKTFIMNALGVPDFSLCIDFRLNLIPLRIIFPDYYFYWPAFPRIPEIPYCKDIRQFCRDVKTKLKEVTDKTKVIEETFNKFAQKKIQEKMNQAAIKIQEKYKQYILQELEKQREKIRKEVEEQIRKGEKTIVISVDDIKIPSIPLDEELGLPNEIFIPWPEELKKISLTKPLTYDLPKIPLKDKLSYQKEVPIKGPGFQERTFTAAFGAYGDCLAGPPSGGNPYPIGQFQSNLNKIETTKTNLQEISQRIIWAVQTERY